MSSQPIAMPETIVDVPGFGRIAFPDDMSPEQIAAVLQRDPKIQAAVKAYSQKRIREFIGNSQAAPPVEAEAIPPPIASIAAVMISGCAILFGLRRLVNWTSSMENSHTLMPCKNEECERILRVPRGRGRASITCPDCGWEWAWNPRQAFFNRWDRKIIVTVGMLALILALWFSPRVHYMPNGAILKAEGSDVVEAYAAIIEPREALFRAGAVIALFSAIWYIRSPRR